MLPFYIFIADYNLILEYDGEGHFQPFRFIKDVKESLKKLEENQKSVQIKNRHCIKNNISSIRIPYWELKNIEYILSHILDYFKVINRDDITTKTGHEIGRKRVY